jgi:hypothetical protein
MNSSIYKNIKSIIDSLTNSSDLLNKINDTLLPEYHKEIIRQNKSTKVNTYERLSKNMNKSTKTILNIQNKIKNG